MKNIYIILTICITLLFGACSDFLEVVPASDKSAEEVFSENRSAANFLGPAYSSVPSSPWVDLEYYTDNAVLLERPQIPAVSGFTVETNPVKSKWGQAYKQIFHINEFFKNATTQTYDAYDAESAAQLKNRTIGEAFGLRAYYKWILLKNFAGPSAKNDEMLGFPIVDKLITVDEANSIPRGTYMECYNSILTDLDSALSRIDFIQYAGNSDISGVRFTGRISGSMIYCLKARMALFAASPAYQQISMEEAANAAYEAIKIIDEESLLDLQPFGNYDDVENPDHLWRKNWLENAYLEKDHFPPSLFGSGECNPSQNFVDAFPDISGYPIGHPNSTYDPNNPYDGRDPRLESFIFHNGLNSFNNAIIKTFIGGDDASGGIKTRATRTGYYMKKFLSADIDLNPDVSGKKKDYKIYPIFTRASLYLDFAEAAVEAYGVAGKGAGMAFSAKDAIQKVRERGGIILDDYLDEAAADETKMKELIKNERRIELCFEGERFYDVRRWKLPLSTLTLGVNGMQITKTGEDSFTYQVKEIEKRALQDHMYYNPIPREEALKSDAIVQNAGWENN